MLSPVVEEGGDDDVTKTVLVTFGNCLLTSRGKYILGLATGSALTSVEAAASAATRSDLVCMLLIGSPRHVVQLSRWLSVW